LPNALKLPDGRSLTHYLAIDRKRERAQAKEATDGSTIFAPAYPVRTREGSRSVRVDLPAGALTIDEFKLHMPGNSGKPPERVVLAAEGDTTQLNALLTSSGNSGGKLPWTTAKAGFAEPPDQPSPLVFFTKNIDRAREHVNAIEKLDVLRIGQIASFELGATVGEPANLDNLWFTPTRGDHARALLIAGDNTLEFRSKLKRIAEAGLLRNKQIALATCFDPKATDELREILLGAGALMVWTPENRISPESARKLRGYMEKVDGMSGDNAPKALDDYVNQALELWYRESPDDTNLTPLLNASRWVELRVPALKTDDPSMKQLPQPLTVTEDGL